MSLREVEELLAERGVIVTYAIRAWCSKFGPSYAAGLRQRRAQPTDKWRLDEVQLEIKGRRYWLWRAVPNHGESSTSSSSSDAISTRQRPSFACDRLDQR